jgi:hypothetical protein
MSTVVNGWYDITDPAYGGPVGSDWTNAMTMAIAAIPSSGGVLYFPSTNSPYHLGAATIPPLPNYATVLGDGAYATRIICSDNSQSIFTTQLGAAGISISAMSLEYESSTVSESSVAITLYAANHVRISDLLIGPACVGIFLEAYESLGCEFVWCTRIAMTVYGTAAGGAGGGAGIQVSGGTVPGVHSQLHFSEIIMGTGQSAPTYYYAAAGYQLSNCSNVFILNCDTVAFVNNILISPGSAASGTAAVQNLQVFNCAFDTPSDSNSCQIETADTGNVVSNVRFTDCWLSGADPNSGVVIAPVAGSTCTAISFSDCFLIHNHAWGAVISGGDHIQITDSGVWQNNESGGTDGGIQINGGSNILIADNNVIGDDVSGGFTSIQHYGVLVQSPAKTILVTANNCAGNVSPIICTTTNADTCYVSDNLGADPVGYVNAMSSSGGFPNPYPEIATVYLEGATSVELKNQGGTYVALPFAPQTVVVGPGQVINYAPAATKATWFLD